MLNRIQLAIVVPCYNEEEVLKETNFRLNNLLQEMVQEQLIKPTSYILYVDDGSKDQTWPLIKEYHQTNEMVRGIKLSRNKGHQNAILAGMTTVLDNCDACVTIDADLQDDIEAIKEMVKCFQQGDEIVLGVRNNRDSDTFIKRKTARLFYKLMNGLGANTIENHADFRLISNRALRELQKYNEVNLFFRGIILDLGFSTSCVYYKRNPRIAGRTKYSPSKMLGLALSGITSFSIKPIRLIFFLGGLFSFLAVVAAIVLAILAIFGNVVGWLPFIFLTIFFVTGLILMALGVVGEYVGRSYMETKHRPRYIIEEKLIH